MALGVFSPLLALSLTFQLMVVTERGFFFLSIVSATILPAGKGSPYLRNKALWELTALALIEHKLSSGLAIDPFIKETNKQTQPKMRLHRNLCKK